jgi:hypothetical protein
VGNAQFQYWLKDGQSLTSGALAATLTMDADHTVTAVYAKVSPTRHFLAVNSRGASGVMINVEPADTSGVADGTTPMTRSFNETTPVTLTAAPSAGGFEFRYWLQDGQRLAEAALTVSITMDADHVMTAVYEPPTTVVRTLTVSSSGADGVRITVGSENVAAVVPFTRSVEDGANITLTAPSTAGGLDFLFWQEDGQVLGQGAVTASVTMDADHTLTAVYAPRQVSVRTLTVRSIGAESVDIVIQPESAAVKTPFRRLLNPATTVTLTAPAEAGTLQFQSWQKDGENLPPGMREAVVTMDIDHALTAVYSGAQSNDDTVRLGTPVISGGKLRLELVTAPAAFVRIEQSSDLVDWQPLTELIVTLGSIVVDDLPVDGIVHFYRAVNLRRNP